MEYNWGKILIPSVRNSFYGDIFVAPEDMAEKSNLGQLFVLLGLKGRDKSLAHKARDLMDLIVSSYYSSPTSDIESSLTATCQTINLNLTDIFGASMMGQAKINILVGVAKADNLVFSSIGVWSGNLFRNKKSSSIVPNAAGEIREEKFSQITVGEARADDVLLFANLSFFDFFSTEKIKEVVLKLSTSAAVEQFKNLAGTVNNAEIIGLVFKYNGAVKKSIESSPQKYLQEFYGSEKSMQRLGNLEQRTSRTLSASLWPGLIKFKKYLTGSIGNIFKRNKKSNRKELQLPKEQTDHVEGREKNKNGWQKINFWRIAKLIPKNNFFKDKKIFIRFIALLIAIFAASIIYLNYEKKTAAENKQLSATLAVIEDKKNEAEAVLIYEEKEKARSILGEALNLAKSYYGVEAKWQELFGQQQKEVTALLNKINNIYEVVLNQTADFSAVNSQIKNIFKNKSAWQILLADGEFYQLDNATKNPVSLWQNDKIKLLTMIGDDIIYFDQENNFYNLDKQGASKELKINLATTIAIAEIIPYGDNLYLLDNSLGEIRKIIKPLAGGAVISFWYQDDKNLIKSGHSMMIDGNIWLVNGNQVLKFFKGKKETFNLGSIDQPLGNDLQIYTEKDWPLMYVLDRQNKRLVVVNKENGGVIKQYLNNDLSSVQQMAVDDGQKNIWSVIDKKVYRMEMK